MLKADQSRLESLVEVCLSTAIGLVTNLVAQRFLFPALGWNPSFGVNLFIAAFFTVVSIVRGYAIRRFFARGLHRVAVAIAARIWSWRGRS